ncbi:hypothetical protein J6590_052099 [Homalodisca vitripennis]|nr:hypothetical protein J6590_052099 [Homalodisca vitripennis]
MSSLSLTADNALAGVGELSPGRCSSNVRLSDTAVSPLISGVGLVTYTPGYLPLQRTARKEKEIQLRLVTYRLHRKILHLPSSLPLCTNHTALIIRPIRVREVGGVSYSSDIFMSQYFAELVEVRCGSVVRLHRKSWKCYRLSSRLHSISDFTPKHCLPDSI